MTIIDQRESGVFRYEAMCGIYITNNNHGKDDPRAVSGLIILGTTPDGRTLPIARYDDERQAHLALGRFTAAIQEGASVFQFPSKEEVTFHAEHRSSFTSKKTSHGGS